MSSNHFALQLHKAKSRVHKQQQQSTTDEVSDQKFNKRQVLFDNNATNLSTRRNSTKKGSPPQKR